MAISAWPRRLASTSRVCLMVALLLEPRPFGRVVCGELVPVDLRPPVGKGLLEGRAVLLPPGRRLLDDADGALGHAHGLLAHLGRLAGLLVDEGDALLLVLGDQRPQRLGHVLPGRLVLGAPEFRRFVGDRRLRSASDSTSASLQARPPARPPAACSASGAGSGWRSASSTWAASSSIATAPATSTDSGGIRHRFRRDFGHGLSFGGHTGSPSVVHDVP